MPETVKTFSGISSKTITLVKPLFRIRMRLIIYILALLELPVGLLFILNTMKGDFSI